MGGEGNGEELTDLARRRRRDEVGRDLEPRRRRPGGVGVDAASGPSGIGPFEYGHSGRSRRRRGGDFVFDRWGGRGWRRLAIGRHRISLLFSAFGCVFLNGGMGLFT